MGKKESKHKDGEKSTRKKITTRKKKRRGKSDNEDLEHEMGNEKDKGDKKEDKKIK